MTTYDSDRAKDHAPSKQATTDYYYASPMTHRPWVLGAGRPDKLKGENGSQGGKGKKKEKPVMHLVSEEVLLKQNAFRLMGGFLRHIALPRLGFADLDASHSHTLVL